jgi:hypothetical protein
MIKIKYSNNSQDLILKDLSNKEINQYNNNTNILENQKEAFGIFCIKENNEEFIGSITNGFCGINININNDKQGNGYGTNAFKMYCHYRFNIKNEEKIDSLSVNQNSHKMHDNIGFTSENNDPDADFKRFQITKKKFYEKNQDFCNSLEISDRPKSIISTILEFLINILKTLFPCCFPKKEISLSGKQLKNQIT